MVATIIIALTSQVVNNYTGKILAITKANNEYIGIQKNDKNSTATNATEKINKYFESLEFLIS